MTQTEWLEYGKMNGWITDSFSYYEGGPELSDEELEDVDEGGLPDVWCFRFYEESR